MSGQWFTLTLTLTGWDLVLLVAVLALASFLQGAYRAHRHRTLGLAPVEDDDTRLVVARCTCGWESKPKRLLDASYLAGEHKGRSTR